MSALSIPTAARIYLPSNLSWFFGNLSSWLWVLPHTDMKNRRFSSPFISFYEIVIIPTSGSFPSVWTTVIPSAFSWSSTLFLDLPVCGSALIFPISSPFPLGTMSKTQHAALQLKLCQCWRERKEHFGCPEGTEAQNSRREKIFPLSGGTCDNVHRVESHGHVQMHKNYFKKRTENLSTYRKEWIKSATLQHLVYCAPCSICTSFSQPWTVPHISSPHSQLIMYRTTSTQLHNKPIIPLSPPLYSTSSDSFSAFSPSR